MPTGTVTLIFTDIEGSTRLWEELSQEVMLPILEAHNTVIREAKDNWSGYEVRTEGDAFFLSFAKATHAVHFAIEAQLALARYDWPESTGQIRVRMGMHTGDVAIFEGDYQGTTANLAKRVSDAGHGGQVLISATAHHAVKEHFPTSWLVDLGRRRFKNLRQPEQIFQVAHPELQKDFPRLRTLDNLPNNLPLQLTSFVGREAEIRQIVNLLKQPHGRFVTLRGAPGIGKTRLSMQVAAEAADEFPDGVWFIRPGTANRPRICDYRNRFDAFNST